jgi:uncharacterized Zn-binding protein involved in type VI secretion
MFPAARLSDRTASQDPIIAPGVPNVLIGGLPAACIGDSVSGPTIVGVIATGSSNVWIGGRPAARITSLVSGIHPITGLPVPGGLPLVTGQVNVLIGG